MKKLTIWLFRGGYSDVSFGIKRLKNGWEFENKIYSDKEELWKDVKELFDRLF